jgi:metalloendopeptidase OMA1, mitochondrial
MRLTAAPVLLAAAFALMSAIALAPRHASAAEPLTLTTKEEENTLGEAAYQDILKNEKVCKDPVINEFVRRVGNRITQAAPDMGFKYEIVVLDSEKINAFCLPGGKIAVYTGILPFCENEAGLATVMGHEVAHAILRHGGQRMTQGTVVNVIGSFGSELLKQAGASDLTQSVARGAYGYGTQLGILLPYSRSHESEADLHGLNYLARAGYDPREAPKFWERFSVLKSDTPTFLSTHPAHEDRAQRLSEALPKAGKLYEKSPKYGVGEAVPEAYRTAPKPAEAAKPAQPVEPEQPKKKKKKKKDD